MGCQHICPVLIGASRDNAQPKRWDKLSWTVTEEFLITNTGS